MDRIDRFRGALVGLAIGDAVGTTLEFRSPGSFRPLADLEGGGPFGLAPGQWTDDTSMALCLAASLVRCRGFDAADQMRRYVAWWRRGYLSSTGRCFDIGGTTAQALARFERDGNPLAGPTHEASAGNGSLMRLAPVPMFKAAKPPNTLFASSAASSGTTHGAPQAIDACGAYGVMLGAALNGAPKADLLALDVPGVLRAVDSARPLHPAVQAVLDGSFRVKEPPAIRGTGYVVDTLEAALWALDRTSSFRDGLLRVVNLGDDADTTGAVYGQLAGALYGYGAIPAAWCERLALHDLIVGLADALEALSRGAAAVVPPHLDDLDARYGLA